MRVLLTIFQDIINDVHVKCLLLTLLGQALNMATKMNGVRTKALSNNLEFSYSKYFNDEKIALIANFIASLMAMLFVDDIVKSTGKEWVALVMLSLAGFIGSEFVIRLLGVANKRVNDATAYKSKKADDVNNTTDKPTPVQ